MKRFMILFLAVVLVFNNMLLAVSAESCEHQWSLKYDPKYNYEYEDDEYHILVDIELHYECKVCGEAKVEYQEGNGALGKHAFTGNKSYSCGYVREEEKHEHNWKLRYDPQYNYEYVDENYHALVDIDLYYKCSECGETKHEVQDGDYELSKHVYSGNVCYTCGYEKSDEAHSENNRRPEMSDETSSTTSPNVTEEPSVSLTPTPTIAPTATPVPEHTHSWRMAYDPWYQYADYDENYHILSKIVLTYACDCGVVSTEEQYGNGEISEHKFDGQVCVICGHVQALTDSENPEPPTIDGSNEVVSPGTSEEITHICRFEEPYLTWIGAYTECNVQTHTQQRVKFAYCVECGEKHIFSNTAEVVPHTIENGSCKWCKQKVFSTESEVELATAQLDGLKKLSDKLEKIQKNKDSHFTKDAYNSIKSSIQTLQMQYEAVLRGERFIDGIPRYQDDDVLKMFLSLQAENLKSIKLPTSASTKVEVQLENLYIDLENPDNKWYYLVGDLGEQVILGNFSDKSTLGGTALQILVGEIPFVGTAADIRDITADLVNWEWSWQYVGVTTLDVIGLIPVVGSLKYAGDLKVVSKGVELTDDAADILTAAMKHADDVSDLASKSDDVTEIVTKALVKHADEVGDVSKFTAKNFDDVVNAVKHPDIFSDTALEHIFKGNKSGGFHYEGLADANGKILKITKPANSAGVYETTVEIAGKAKKKPSTFFPKTWTPEQVLDAIEQVLNNPDSIDAARNTYEGTVKGVKIHLNFDTYGKIRSAYPVL